MRRLVLAVPLSVLIALTEWRWSSQTRAAALYWFTQMSRGPLQKGASCLSFLDFAPAYAVSRCQLWPRIRRALAWPVGS